MTVLDPRMLLGSKRWTSTIVARRWYTFRAREYTGPRSEHRTSTAVSSGRRYIFHWGMRFFLRFICGRGSRTRCANFIRTCCQCQQRNIDLISIYQFRNQPAHPGCPGKSTVRWLRLLLLFLQMLTSRKTSQKSIYNLFELSHQCICCYTLQSSYHLSYANWNLEVFWCNLFLQFCFNGRSSEIIELTIFVTNILTFLSTSQNKGYTKVTDFTIHQQTNKHANLATSNCN